MAKRAQGRKCLVVWRRGMEEGALIFISDTFLFLPASLGWNPGVPQCFYDVTVNTMVDSTRAHIVEWLCMGTSKSTDKILGKAVQKMGTGCSRNSSIERTGFVIKTFCRKCEPFNKNTKSQKLTSWGWKLSPNATTNCPQYATTSKLQKLKKLSLGTSQIFRICFAEQKQIKTGETEPSHKNVYLKTTLFIEKDVSTENVQSTLSLSLIFL